MNIKKEQILKLEVKLEKLAPSKYAYLFLSLFVLVIGFAWDASALPLSGLTVGVLVLSSAAYVERISYKRIELLKRIIELKMDET